MEEEDEEDVDSEVSGSDDDNISCMYITIMYNKYVLFHKYLQECNVRTELK